MDTIIARSNGTQASAGAITISHLEEGKLYDFVVYSRNRHMDAWEGHGSQSISARPLRAPTVPRDLRAVEINSTTVRLAFMRPEEAVSLSGYRISRLLSRDSLVSSLPLANQTVVASVDTSDLGLADVFVYVTGLQVGQIYFFAVQAVNPGGGGADMRITVRPFGPSSGPEGLQARMANSNSALLIWKAPINLGLSSGLQVSGYQVVAVMPPGARWDEAGSSIVQVGTTSVLSPSGGMTVSHALANTTIEQMQGLQLTYGVYALVRQDLDFGGGIVRGAVAVTSVAVGHIPSWSDQTPPDGSVIMAWIGQTVVVQLQVQDPDIATGAGNIRFELFGAAPPGSGQGIMSAGIVSEGAVLLSYLNHTATSQLIFKGSRQLSGSRYKVCVRGVDSTNLTTHPRCYSVQIPRPTPVFVSPPNNSSYATAVGCHLIIPLVAHDRTSFDLDPALGGSNGYQVFIQPLYTFTSSRYHELKSVGLPPGAALTTQSPVAKTVNVSLSATGVSSTSIPHIQTNPANANLQWIARKGQESYKYRVCVVAIDASKAFSSVGDTGGGAKGSDGGNDIFCLDIDVQRCRYCPQEQDSLQTVAKAWHGAWLEVWAGNHLYNTPDSLLFDAFPPLQSPAPPASNTGSARVAGGDFSTGERNKLQNSFDPIDVGVIYAVDAQDDLWHISLRYGLDMSDILFWNPDLADGKAKELQVSSYVVVCLCVCVCMCVHLCVCVCVLSVCCACMCVLMCV